MQDRRQIAIEGAGIQRGAEMLFVEVVGDIAIGEIAEFVGAAEVVDREDVGLPAVVERLDDVRSDKSGRAGDDDLHGRSVQENSSSE